MTELEEAEQGLVELTRVTSERDARVRRALAAGMSKNRVHTLTGISRSTIDRLLKENAMTVTATDIRDYVVNALTAGESGEDFDVDAIVDELKATYDLIGDDSTMTVDDIPFDEFWAVVAKHDTTASA